MKRTVLAMLVVIALSGFTPRSSARRSGHKKNGPPKRAAYGLLNQTNRSTMACPARAVTSMTVDRAFLLLRDIQTVVHHLWSSRHKVGYFTFD